MAKYCPICNEKMGLLQSKVSDGKICPTCTRICSAYATKKISEIQEYWRINSERRRAFIPTQKLKSILSEVVTVDATNRFFAFGDITKEKKEFVIYAFDEVDSYEFEIVGQKTVTKKKGGVTRAIVGGVIAGPVGALVGSGTAKEESKTTGGTAVLKVNLLTYSGKQQRVCHNPPNGFTAFLDNCMLSGGADSNVVDKNQLGVADEIVKFKSYLDQGIITQEEFDAKKKQILGL